MFSLRRFSAWCQGIILAACCVGLIVHFTVTLTRVGKKIGDYDVNREFGQRFLAGEPLYQDGLCFNYMPVNALYWSPFALMSPRIGMVFRYLTALVCLTFTLRWLQRMAFFGQDWALGNHIKTIIVSLLLAAHYLIRDFDDGGPHVILLTVLMGGIFCIWQGRQKLAAFWLGLGIAVKITPGLFLPFFLWKRQWRLAAYTSVATMLWILLPAVWMGPNSWWHHQQQWSQVALSVFRDSPDAARLDNESRVQNQALKPAMAGLLLEEPFAWPTVTANRLANLGLLAVWVLFCWRSRVRWHWSNPKIMLGQTSALLLLVLLFSPVTWLQHFVFALPALFWIVLEERTNPRVTTKCLLGLYVVLTLLMNRELLGREVYLVLLSYHMHTACLLLLLGLVLMKLPAQVRATAGQQQESFSHQDSSLRKAA
jgi:alpha-1,2-mannosyltransferase